MTPEEICENIAEAMNAFNDSRGWEIDGDQHSVVMILTDIVQFARIAGVDFEVALAEARDLDEEVNQ